MRSISFWFTAATLAVSLEAPVAGAEDGQRAPALRLPVESRALLTVGAAQPPDSAPPLTLQAALDEALERNPELIALRRQFEAARHRPAQVRSLAPPSFEAQIWAWPLTTLNPGNTDMYMFTVGQEIPGRGKRALREAVAAKDVELAEAEIAVRARHVIEQVKRVYADLFLARKAIEIHHDNVALLRQFADISEAKYVTGRISQQDVLKSVVEISRIHDHLIELEERGRLAEARLNTLLNRPPGAPIGPVAEPRAAVFLPESESLQRLALERQPELAAARLAIERAEAELTLARRETGPDFFVRGGYFLMPDRADSFAFSVGVTWPRAPWARGGVEARVAEASADLHTVRARLDAAENAVRLAVQEAYVRTHAAEERAALLRTSILPQSDQALEVSRAAYQTDRVDLLALIDNQRTLLDVELGYYRALADLEQALADLERAVGTEIAPAGTVPATNEGN